MPQDLALSIQPFLPWLAVRDSPYENLCINPVCQMCYKASASAASQGTDVMEQPINELCSELLRSQNPTEAEFIGEQLRSAIHEHVENLRDTVIALPALDALVQTL